MCILTHRKLETNTVKTVEKAIRRTTSFRFGMQFDLVVSSGLRAQFSKNLRINLGETYDKV